MTNEQIRFIDSLYKDLYLDETDTFKNKLINLIIGIFSLYSNLVLLIFLFCVL